MKQVLSYPKITLVRLVLLLTLSLIVVADSGCMQKPGCGNKRDHRRRKKSVKKFAPGMSYMFVKPTQKKNSWFA